MHQHLNLSDILVRVGLAIADAIAWGVRHDLTIVGLLCLVFAGVVSYGLWFRETLPGRMLLYSNRRAALWLNARLWAPSALIAGAIGLAFMITIWLPEASWPLEYPLVRPDWYPATIPFWVVLALLGANLGQALLKIFDWTIEYTTYWRWAYPLGGALVLAPFGAIAPPSTWPEVLELPARPAVITLVVLVVPVVLGVLTLWRRMGREKVFDFPGKNGGFASRNEVANNKCAVVTIPIKVSHRGSVRPWDYKRNGPLGWTTIQLSRDSIFTHCLVVGQTGSGKGLALVGPLTLSLIAMDERSKLPFKFIVQDVKGVCQGKDQYEARLGRSCLCWGAAAIGQTPSLRWNPIREALDSRDPRNESNALAAMLMPDKPGQGSWIPETARPLLAAIILSGNYPTLKDIFDDLQARGLMAMCVANDCAVGDLIALKGKNAHEYVVSEFKNALICYSDGGWGEKVTSGHDFYLDGPDSFLEVGGYVLSAENLKERKAPLRLFWQYLFRRLQAEPKIRQLLLIMDEALAAGPIPGARDGLNVLREYKVGIFYCIQHLNGLKEVYGRDEGESLISSFASKIWLFRGMNDDDKMYLSRILGERTRERKVKGRTEPATEHGPLLGPPDMGGLARGDRDYWGVFDCVSQTNPNDHTGLGLPILGKAEATTPILQRKPSQEEIDVVVATYAERTPFTAPVLTREAVERMAQATGIRELLDLVPKEEGKLVSILDSIPSAIRIIHEQIEPATSEKTEAQAETVPADDNRAPWE